MVQSCMITIWTMFVSLMCTLLTHILLYIFYLLQGCLTHKHGVSLLSKLIANVLKYIELSNIIKAKNKIFFFIF